MIFRRATLLSLLLALALPGAFAHGEGLRSGELLTLTLDPGAASEHHLERASLEPQTGPILTLNAGIVYGPGPIEVALTTGDRTIARWTFTADDLVQQPTVRVPESEDVHLVVRNLGVSQTRFELWFDESCRCALKMLPPDLPRGLAVFEAGPPPNASEGARWHARVEEPPVHNLSVALAVRVNDSSVWPQDFRVVKESRRAVVTTSGAHHDLTWSADPGAQYFLFVRTESQDLRHLDPEDPEKAARNATVAVSSAPVVVDAAAAPPASGASSTPAPSGWLLVGGAVAAAVAFGRRR